MEGDPLNPAGTENCPTGRSQCPSGPLSAAETGARLLPAQEAEAGVDNGSNGSVADTDGDAFEALKARAALYRGRRLALMIKIQTTRRSRLMRTTDSRSRSVCPGLPAT